MADSACRRKDMLNTLINLSAKMSNKKWNKKEVTYLVDNYGKMSLEELSANLGRSVMAVRLSLIHI